MEPKIALSAFICSDWLQDKAPEDLLAAAVRVARACVDTDPKRRPRMNEVHTSLTVSLEVRDFL